MRRYGARLAANAAALAITAHLLAVLTGAQPGSAFTLLALLQAVMRQWPCGRTPQADCAGWQGGGAGPPAHRD